MSSNAGLDFAHSLGYKDERELARQNWNAELDRKVEEYFGSHIYLKLREGYINDLVDLRMCLTEREYEFVLTVLRRAALDYEKLVRHGWDEGALVGMNYPRTFRMENGSRGQEKRQALIQIFV
ncbi:hypothetical protein [Candidatus Methanoperedens nitratireducens]|uniref:Uncharacterized protein n=1 Tax=Candidatus Methanoperedens nitratireducens TaxID=1392998 RepID=A0A284VSV1_9EURY|nr:hypothetical protein [Candidatus Methanoperedens nitroreducens]SNQ62267.1 hypothetical protein MNV_660005 [Candidatus Methanoperedens nitroreducens]